MEICSWREDGVFERLSVSAGIELESRPAVHFMLCNSRRLASIEKLHKDF